MVNAKHDHQPRGRVLDGMNASWKVTTIMRAEVPGKERERERKKVPKKERERERKKATRVPKNLINIRVLE
jgi:hypothetical protein